ncbi:MAG: PIN domain-containing protein [Alphaproteobacteria bacterium]|nr:PIN domain-containing protein [Alphaproteobacteria bacterium]
MSPFIDTNVLVYSVSDDSRRERALEVLSAGGIISVQVLNEVVSVLFRKLGRNWNEIHSALRNFIDLFPEIRPITLETHTKARSLAQAHDLNLYDALIVAAALEAQCSLRNPPIFPINRWCMRAPSATICWVLLAGGVLWLGRWRRLGASWRMFRRLLMACMAGLCMPSGWSPLPGRRWG